MRCMRCGKPISPLRQLSDREYCGDGCRKRGPRASAAGLRDLEYDDFGEWSPASLAPRPKPAGKSGAGLGLVLLAVVGVMVAGRFWLGDEAPRARRAPVAVVDVAAPQVARAGQNVGDRLTGWLQDLLPGEKPLRLKTSFSEGLGQWAGGANWRKEGEVARPGRLRLWQATVDKQDYDFNFLGQIDRKAISWAFRAGDERNYYASKIELNRQGELSGASIHRYIVQKAETVSHVEMPLPVVLERNRPYQFTIAVEGNRFRTLIDGHVIDEWSDNRFAKGGVGFYSGQGELAGLHWVSFRERKGLMSRFMAAALFLPPAMAGAAVLP